MKKLLVLTALFFSNAFGMQRLGIQGLQSIAPQAMAVAASVPALSHLQRGLSGVPQDALALGVSSRVSDKVLQDAISESHIKKEQSWMNFQSRVGAYGGFRGLGGPTRVLLMSAQDKEVFSEKYKEFFQKLSSIPVDNRKSVYRELAKECHPDSPGGNETVFKALQKAWENLKPVGADQDTFGGDIYERSEFIKAARRSDYKTLEKLFVRCYNFELIKSFEEAAKRHDFRMMVYLYTMIPLHRPQLNHYLDYVVSKAFEKAVQRRDYKLMDVLLNKNRAAFQGLQGSIAGFEQVSFFALSEYTIDWAFEVAGKRRDFEMMDYLLQSGKLKYSIIIGNLSVSTVLKDAAQRGDIEMMQYIITNFSKYICYLNFYATLRLAYENKDAKAAKILLSSKNFAWHILLVTGYVGLLKYLYEDGKKRKAASSITKQEKVESMPA